MISHYIQKKKKKKNANPIAREQDSRLLNKKMSQA